MSSRRDKAAEASGMDMEGAVAEADKIHAEDLVVGQAGEAHTMEREQAEEAHIRVEVQLVEHRSRAEEEMHVILLATLEIMEEAVVKMSVAMKQSAGAIPEGHPCHVGREGRGFLSVEGLVV